MPHASAYLKAIEKALAAGNATEHTHRPALKSFIESLADGVMATNEPKRVRFGAPDFVVTRRETPLGYVEAKDVGVPLDREEKSAQMKRYLEGSGNLVLTDYLEFRWYVGGVKRMTARLAIRTKAGKLRAEADGAGKVEELLTAFLNEQTATVGNAKELAVRMARIARLIRGKTNDALAAEDLTDDKPDPLHDQLASFRKVLLPALTEEEFADMYAQTICYGLFAARCNSRRRAEFTRDSAARLVPKTNPFLQRTFYQMVGPDLSPHVSWAVDDLVALLAHTDIEAILQDFGKRTRREDPVVHFYETFLAAYDPKLRETRGVYYTPEPVVSYIVRSVDHLLKNDFKLAGGLADSSKIQFRKPGSDETVESHKLLILDPATGTGTFLFGTINHIYESLRKTMGGAWSAYVAKELLPRLFGFELLMAPYTVAHLKLGLLLEDTKIDLEQVIAEEGDKAGRLHVYLTNTLEEVHRLSSVEGFTRWLSEEADEASRVKQERPVMVVMGNPPYSGHSANTGQWIADLLRGRDTHTGEAVANYFEVDGRPLGERQPKWLNDDYVKFMRFAQWRIEQTGYGVLAFITNHGYLDNPTFRGMRQSLMETFDDIYVLDLHGNSKKKERAPDGSKDENVFDIQQGVAIGLFVKRKGASSGGESVVRHAHLWGVREIYEEKEQGDRILSGGKYHWLWHHDVSTTKWTTLAPQSPSYLFIPQDELVADEYGQGWALRELMPENTVGIVTARDSLTIHYNREEVLTTVRDFSSMQVEEAREHFNLGKDARDWKVEFAQRDLRSSPISADKVASILYRPFDVRFTYYTGQSRGFIGQPQQRIMGHMLAGNNLGLSTTRSIEIGRGWEHVFCTSQIIQHHTVSLKEVNYLFPLYLYPDGTKKNLFDTDEPGGRRPNLAPEFVAEFVARLKMTFVPDGKGDRAETFGPEDVFSYMYAVFHSPAYRSRYAEFLKVDFPRLPLTSDPDLFRALCALGDELVGLHLMERQAPLITSYPQDGTHEVEQVRYTAPGEAGSLEGRVWINKTQYFEGVSEEVWSFHVGGYQVCQKWLKDRKGRKLTFDDLKHYQQIVSALSETIRLMVLIDDAIDEHGGWPLGEQNS